MVFIGVNKIASIFGFSSRYNKGLGELKGVKRLFGNSLKEMCIPFFFWIASFILVWMAGRSIFLGFNRSPYQRFFYLLLSKYNQVKKSPALLLRIVT